VIEAVRRQYRAYAGFVTTPQFFDAELQNGVLRVPDRFAGAVA